MNEQTIFLAAVGIADADTRKVYLEQACAGDSVLRRQVEALLTAHARSGTFLEVPALEQIRPADSAPGALASPDSALSTMSPSGAASPGEKPSEAPADDSEADALAFLQASARPDALGRLAHYEVLELLGQGGFGTVVKAFDDKLHRIVAIKIMSPQLASLSPARKRFLREARSSASIRHENVVDIHAIEEQPLPFLVMEYVAGETLQQRLDRVGPLETIEIVRIGEQVARGLAAAHAMGRVHRDIKPANILLENGISHVKITDFGLARTADDASLTQSGVIVGTPLYMAPEQALGSAIDHRADLFSLGSVLYAMCTGRPPFRASTTLAVLKRVAEDDPRPIREIVPEIPQWLAELIARLHAKKPEARFQTAQELADQLRRYLVELETHGRVQDTAAIIPHDGQQDAKAPTAAQSIPPQRRVPRISGLLGLIATVLVLLGTGLGFTEATGVTNVRGAVIRLFSPDGALVVEVDDPDVRVTIDGEDLVIEGAGVKELRLKPGRYKVEASKDGKIVRQELVTITRNDRRLLRISRDIEPLAKAGSGKATKTPEGKKPPVRPIPGKSRFALAYTVEDHVDLPTLSFDPNGPTTVEVFVRLDAFPSDGRQPGGTIIGKSAQFDLYLNAPLRQIRFGACSVHAAYRAIPPESPVEMWMHVAGVRAERELRLYFDGKRVARTATPMFELGNGKGIVNLGRGIIGQIKEARVSKTARYDLDFTPPDAFESDKDTLALYRFNEGKGEALADSSGNNHHGTIHGAKWVRVKE